MPNTIWSSQEALVRFQVKSSPPCTVPERVACRYRERQRSGSGATSPLIVRDARPPIPPRPATADRCLKRPPRGASTCASSGYRRRPRRGCELRSRVGPYRRPLLRRRLRCGNSRRRHRHRCLCHLPSPVPPPVPLSPPLLRLVGCPPDRLEWRHPCYPLRGLAAVPPVACPICLILFSRFPMPMADWTEMLCAERLTA